MKTCRQILEANYVPDKKYPLVISKTTSRWFIYEKDEPDPVVKKSFKTSAEAKEFAEKNYAGYKIEIEE